MQRYHFFRTDPANSEDRPIPIQSQRRFCYYFFLFFLCNLEFTYFSVLTRSSLFCELNTIYYSVSQLVGQKCWVCSPNVGCETVLSGSWIVYSQRNDINKKRNSKLLFWCKTFILKDVHESCWHCQIIWLRGSSSKERVPEKNALSQFSIWGQMRCWQV